MRRSHRFVALILSLVFCAAAAAQTAVPADLDAYVQRAMKEFDVPGMSVAIVKDGRTVYAKGFGVRKLGEPGSVDENTLFGIASNTKAFTAASVALLVDDKKLDWDDRVIDRMPEFRVADAYVTNELTIRDLLSHRSGLGLGEGDLLYFPPTDYTRQQVIDKAKFLKPVSSLRSKYAYNNFTFVLAAELAAKVSGEKWDDLLSSRIFGPIGMTSTIVTSSAYKPGGNFATPHSRGWRLDGKLEPIAVTNDDAWAGAAGIKSSAADLSKWVAVQLNGGKTPDGKVIFSEAAQRQMWAVQIPITITNPTVPALMGAKPQFAGYGLGWSLRDYKGHKIVGHGGALTGMLSTVQMMPDQKLGIVVLTNQEENGAMMSVVYHIIDHNLGLPQNDWIGGYRQQRQQSIDKANAAEQKAADARAKDSHTLVPLDRFAGTYHDAWYGDATVANENNHLVLRFAHTPLLVADLSFWQFDTFKAVFRDKTVPDAYVTFWFDSDGKVDQVKMIPTNDLADFSFDYQDLQFKPVAKP